MTSFFRSRRAPVAAAGATGIGLVGFAAALVATTQGLNASTGQPPAGAPPAAAAAQPATTSAPPPGWYARYTPAAAPKAGKGQPIGAFSPSAAFALKPGQAVYPGIPPAGFEASYDAEVKIVDAGRYRFGAEVEGGKVQVTVFGKGIAKPVTASADRSPGAGPVTAAPMLTDWINLATAGGMVTVQIVFTRSGDAPARLRAMWEMERAGIAGFALEPLASTHASVASYGLKDTAAARTAFDGRVLLGQLGCVNCHDAGPGAGALGPVAKGPVLTSAGARLYHDWIRTWIGGPQKIEPGCGMPDLLGDSEKDRQDADAITHFLVSRGGPAPFEAAATEPETLKLGKDLYHTVGCVACHGPLEIKKNAPPFIPPEPFGHLAGKFTPSALAGFLHGPAQSHPQGGMPSLTLSHAEADLIATYLISAWGKTEKPADFTIDAAKAKAGQLAFSARGCAACHDAAAEPGGAPIASTFKAKAMAQLSPGKGCLDPADKSTPRYTLEENDRAALSAALASAKSWSASSAPAPVDACLRSVDALGCTHCHEYNGDGGVPSAIKKLFTMTVEADLGDEGRVPPLLTGVGGKLNTSWLSAVLNDGGRARPYMATRMPQFAAGHLQGLAEGLAAADGVWPNTDRREPRASQEMVQAGQKLVGDTALNCISCHIYGGSPPTGTPGPAMTSFAERVRYDWFARFVVNPQRFKPLTRMTNLFVTEGNSAISEVYGGNGAKQADAMWAYFTLGEFMPAPAGIEQAKGLQIRVGERPRVMRTFLKHAGSRGIAVGFPEAMGGVHFAFDAENSRLVEAWRGDFLDAAGVWAGRGGNVVGGQGGKVWSAPAGPALVVGAKPDAWPTTPGREVGIRFRGYTIDDRGVPTFMYELPAPPGTAGPVAVRERFEPARAVSESQSAGLRRTFEVSGLPLVGDSMTVWLNAGTGTSSVFADPGARWETVKHQDGSVWYGFVPRGLTPGVDTKPLATESISFSVEISP